jgi:hypothetical protein
MATTGRMDPKARLSPLWPCFRPARHGSGQVCHPCRSRQVLEAIELHRRSGSMLRRRRWARGQAIVEFAMVAPLFFALIFGLIEFSLIGVSMSSYNLAAEDGARIGSLLGRTDPTVDQQIVSAVAAHVNGVSIAHPLTIEIFKADVTGQPVTSGGNIVENVYDINGNSIGTPSWPVSSRIDQLLSADYLGVRITYEYNYLTAFVSGGNSTLILTATSIQRIEPQDYQGRRAAPPVQLAMAGFQADMSIGTSPELSRFADRPRFSYFQSGESL